MNNTNEPESGAAWKKKDKNGNWYLFVTMEIGGQKYGCPMFANKFKEKENQPDFRSPRKDKDEAPF